MSPASRKIRLIMELRRNGLTDIRVLGAMELMPRELFAPESFRDQAYENATLPIACHQTMSAPIVVGLMTQALELGERMKVLEIGTGSGYQAAVLSRLCRRVYTIEKYTITSWKKVLLLGAPMKTRLPTVMPCRRRLRITTSGSETSALAPPRTPIRLT